MLFILILWIRGRGTQKWIRGCARSIPNMNVTDRCFLGCPTRLNQLNIVLHFFCITLLGSYKKNAMEMIIENDGIDGSDGKDVRDDTDDADR